MIIYPRSLPAPTVRGSQFQFGIDVTRRQTESGVDELRQFGTWGEMNPATLRFIFNLKEYDTFWRFYEDDTNFGEKPFNAIWLHHFGLNQDFLVRFLGHPTVRTVGFHYRTIVCTVVIFRGYSSPFGFLPSIVADPNWGRGSFTI